MTVVRTMTTLVAGTGFLGGCITYEVKGEGEAEMVDMDRPIVIASVTAPLPMMPGAPLAKPVVHKVADLELHSHAVSAETLGVLRQSMDAELARQHGAQEVDEASTEGYPLLLPLAPLGVVLLPLLLADLAAAAAVVSSQAPALDRAAADRTLIVAYEQGGRYRWHLCCPKGDLVDAYGLKALDLPDRYVSGSDAEQFEVPSIYQRDRWVLVCDRAKRGDGMARSEIRRRFDPATPDQLQTYFQEGTTVSVARSLHLREDVDCHDLSDAMIAAENTSSPGTRRQ